MPVSGLHEPTRFASGRASAFSIPRRISSLRSFGLPRGCRATKSRHSSMSRSIRGITWRYGSIFALHLLYDCIEPSSQRGVGLSLRRVVGRIVREPPRQKVILGGGEDLIPIDSLGRVIVLASFLIRGMKVVGIISRTLSLDCHGRFPLVLRHCIHGSSAINNVPLRL